MRFGGIWAIAVQTFRQGLRMKVAALFIILLVLSLTLLPFALRGDGTLSGRIRTFLGWSVQCTSLFLILVTVFVSVGVVSSDVRNKQIFSVVTKPVPRWCYVLGRWLGVVLLDVLLLALAGAFIYGVSQYLRRQPATNAIDRRTVETEIFVARAEVGPKSRNLSNVVDERIAALKKDKHRYAAEIEAYMVRDRLTEKEAETAFRKDLLTKLTVLSQTAPPAFGQGGKIVRGSLRWIFEGIHVAGRNYTSTGTVQAVSPDTPYYHIKIDPETRTHVIMLGPVKVDGLLGQVKELGNDFFEVLLYDSDRAKLLGLKAGDTVSLQIDPVIQISYKANPSSSRAELKTEWLAVNPVSRIEFRDGPRDIPIGMRTTLVMPANLVDPNGTLLLAYYNWSPASVKIKDEDIRVLYRVSGFMDNFLRAMLRMLIPLMFVAAVGVLAGTFLSFPVGCLTALLLLLVFGLMRGFLAEAVNPSYVEPGVSKIFQVVGHAIFWVMRRLLPDLSSPAEPLMDGMRISWKSIWHSALLTMGARVVIVISLASLIFHKRELDETRA